MLHTTTARLTAVLLAIVTVAIGLAAVLNYYKFRSSLTELQQSRYAFVLGEISSTIETSLNIGLPLEQLQNVDSLLASHASQDDAILSIDIFRPDGAVMFSTDASFIGDLAAKSWVKASQSEINHAWFVERPDANATGVQITNSLGQIVGSVVIRYSNAGAIEKLDDIARRLALVALGIVALSTLAGGWLLRHLVGPWNRQIRDLGSISQVLRGTSNQAEPKAGLSVGGSPSTLAAKQRLSDVLEDIERTRGELRELDRMA